MKVINSKYFKIFVGIICIAATASTLNEYAKLIHHLIKINYNWQFEWLMVIGMLFFQYPFIYKKAWAVKLDYYFNMLLVSLFGAILLWPLLTLNKFYHLGDVVNVSYFFAVVLFMFFEHKRRVAKLLMPPIISYTYILYRFIIFIFII